MEIVSYISILQIEDKCYKFQVYKLLVKLGLKAPNFIHDLDKLLDTRFNFMRNRVEVKECVMIILSLNRNFCIEIDKNKWKFHVLKHQ